MRFLQITVFVMVALICGFAPAHAEKRVALVIGNSSYQHVGRLPNPVSDAAAMAALFKSAGFDVADAHKDLGIAAMRRAVGDFADKARDSDIAVIYFAGHGIEVDGVNYLIPVDAVLALDFDVEDETISLDRALKAIDSARRLRLVILDACRSNPFVASMKRSSRAIGRGLSVVEPNTTDTLVAFAAKAGSTAADGDSDHSPFTAALLRHIATPGLDIRLARGAVRDTVMASTSPRQEPFVYGSLGGRTIAIVEGGGSPPIGGIGGQAAAPSPTVSDAERTSGLIQNTTSLWVLDDYIRQYGNAPIYGPLAKARREEVAKSQVAVVVPVTPPSSQMAVLYEEDLANFEGTRYVGNAIWRIERVPRGAGQNPEVVIHGDIEIPDRKLVVRLSLRHNDDRQLPASHTVEIQFKPPPDFSHGSIGNVPGIMVKEGETTRGIALSGIAVRKISSWSAFRQRTPRCSATYSCSRTGPGSIFRSATLTASAPSSPSRKARPANAFSPKPSRRGNNCGNGR